MIFVLTRSEINIKDVAQGLKFHFGKLTQASSYTIKNLKLEEGSVATIWSPAADENVTSSKLTIEANKISSQVSNLSKNLTSYQE
jgi:hypothetical protein